MAEDDAEELALQLGREKVTELVNEAALELKLKELTARVNPNPDLAWVETLTVTAAEPLALEDAEDDLKRELAFYNQALAAVKVAQARFAKLGVPHVRPDDYFAEMVKSDNHMTKVKRRMVNDHQRIIEQEERQRQKANKKFGKQVQRETLVARAQQKKREINEVTKLRKTKKTQGDAFDIDVYDEPAGKSFKDKGGGPMSKRELKDKKFGKHRRDKRNTSESTGDDRGFNRGGKTFGRGGKGGRGKGSGANRGGGKGGRGGGKGGRGVGGPAIKKKRPGKEARKGRK